MFMGQTTFSGPVVSNNGFVGGVSGGAVAATTVTATGAVTAKSASALTAGGAAMFVGTNTAASMGIYFGSGVPTISAAQGSLYMRSDGSSTSTRAYVNTNGTTGWTAITTAS
jgi:hypothetical protein